MISVTLLIGIFVSLRYNQSAAWFLNNKNVTASGIQVTIDDPSTATASLTPYAVISIEDALYTHSEEQTYTLPSHDPNGIIYNANEKALVILINLSVNVASNVTVTLQTSNAEISYEQDNVISNCMKITQATYDPQARTALAAANTTKNFVTVAGATISKVSSLHLSNHTIGAGGTMTLCYIIEYYQEFFDYVRDNKSGSVSEMTFINDIEFVIEFTEQ